MKIGLCGTIPTETQTSGGGILLLQTAKHLSRRGHDVWIFSRNQPSKDVHYFCDENNIKLKLTGYVDNCFIQYILTIPNEINLLNKYVAKFDLIHSHTGPFGFSVSVLKKKHRVCSVLTIHDLPEFKYKSSHFEKILAMVEKKTLLVSAKYANAVTVVSDHLRRELKEKYGINSTLIPYGVDPKKFKCGNNNARNKGKIVLFMGRLVEEKGLDILIKAIPLVTKEIKDATFLIGGIGPLVETLNKQINELKIEDRVKFLGYIPHTLAPMYYVYCDLFVMPSRHESGRSVAILEAMASGKTVVASDVGGNKELVPNRECLFESEDVEDLSQKIICFLKDEENLKMNGLNNRRLVEINYSWDNTVDKYISLYDDVITSTS